jgi:hypothetical protein
MTEEKNINYGQGLGIAGFVLGIIAIVLAIIPCIGLFALIPGISGIVLSAIGLSQALKSNSPKGLVMAGLIISIFATLFAPIWTITFTYKFKSKIENATKDIVKDEAVIDSISKNVDNEMEELKDRDKSNYVNIADYDKLIKDYNVLITDLDKIAKKAKSGDVKAITEFSAITLKITNVTTKLSRIATSLTAEQVKEFERLQNNYDSVMNKFNLKK